MVALMRNCPLLLEIDLMKVPQLSSPTMYAIWLHSSHLREFKFSFNANVDADGFPNLPSLIDYSGDELTRNADLYPWFASTPLTTRQQALRPDLETTDNKEKETNGDENTEDESLPSHYNHPPIVSTLTKPVSASFEYLRTIDFTGCSALTDLAVENTVTNAPKLRSLTLAKCPLLTDLSLASISKLGKHLHHLHLAHLVE